MSVSAKSLLTKNDPDRTQTSSSTTFVVVPRTETKSQFSKV